MRRLRPDWWWWACAPPVALAAVMVAFNPAVPVYDEWSMVDLLRDTSLHDFWRPWNEHRIVFPRLVLYGVIQMTGWDTRWEIAFSFVVAAITAVLLLQLVRRQFEAPALPALAVSAVLFSPLAWENWLWGWQLAWYLTNLGLVLAVFALAGEPGRRRFALAVAGAVLASFSLAHGLLVWMVCGPLLARRTWRRYLWPWVGLGVATVTAYLWRIEPSGDVGGGLADSLRYWVAYVTRSVTYQGRWALPTLLMLATAAAAVLVALRGRADAMPWLALSTFALAAGAVTAFGRGGQGIEQARSSRYTTVSGLLVLGLLVLLLQTRRPANFALAGVIALAVAVNFVDGARQARRYHHDQLAVGERCAREATSPRDPCLAALFSDPVMAWRFVQFFRQIR